MTLMESVAKSATENVYEFIAAYRGFDIVQDMRNGEYWAVINGEFKYRDFVLDELKYEIDDYYGG